ncbi:hypothetical protein FANTH_8086 [Fusarium anthophilum]|uniref:Uncharacterized protein n=1 Tax=Fusarium anthophilum TaxID=48485 RepID=A0A8H4ZB40_9HYPO|nr:hypothetical protein FANTH_8086 [Fusarium anthophilum]
MPILFPSSDHVVSVKRWSHQLAASQLAPSHLGVPSSTDDIAVSPHLNGLLLPPWDVTMDAIKTFQASHPDSFCSSSIITHCIAAAAAMPPKMPRLDDLLALLEVFFVPESGASRRDSHQGRA